MYCCVRARTSARSATTDRWGWLGGGRLDWFLKGDGGGGGRTEVRPDGKGEETMIGWPRPRCTTARG